MHYRNVAIIDTSRRDIELDTNQPLIGNTIMSNTQNQEITIKETAQAMPFLGFDDKERNAQPQPSNKLEHPSPILEVNMPQCIPFMGF